MALTRFARGPSDRFHTITASPKIPPPKFAYQSLPQSIRPWWTIDFRMDGDRVLGGDGRVGVNGRSIVDSLASRVNAIDPYGIFRYFIPPIWPSRRLTHDAPGRIRSPQNYFSRPPPDEGRSQHKYQLQRPDAMPSIPLGSDP